MKAKNPNKIYASGIFQDIGANPISVSGAGGRCPAGTMRLNSTPRPIVIRHPMTFHQNQKSCG